jgi:tetratricopeptide (TPR) repeat protein
VAARQKSKRPETRDSRGVILAAMGLAGIAASLFFLKTPKTQTGDDSVRSGVNFNLSDEKTVHAAYAGSESCRECHAEAFAAWAGSHHGLAERLPDAKLDERAFVPANTLKHGSQQTSFRKTNGGYEVLTVGLNRTQEVFAVEKIIANSPLRQMLVPFPGGRFQATEVAFDPRSNEWFNVYGEEDRKPGEWGHWTGRGMNWNAMCATCHNTRLRKNYDASNDIFRTTMAERGVGCESCHGPMREHKDWQYANKGKSAKDPTIKKLTRDQMFDTCAACHSRRGEITGDPKPGESYFDHHLLNIVDETDIYFPDGQVRDENYEVSAFMGSRMFHKGVRCVDCHDFHSAKVRLPGNMMCMSCHGSGATNAPVINPVTHSRHKVFGYDHTGVMTNNDLTTYKPSEIKETGGECVNCHMPQTVYMQRHSRHDHGFTIPDPLLTKQSGVPNACNRCHTDKSVDWSLGYVEKWYGDRMNRLTRTRAQAVARARLGDDAARDVLLKMLQTDEIDYWRAVGANVLERWANEPAVANALINKLTDTNALVRQNIVQTLAALDENAPPEIRDAIRQRLNDSSRSVRIAAARALSSELNLDSLAASEYLHMLNHNSDQPMGQIQLGAFDYARGDATNALRRFQIAAKWDPFSAGIRHEIAILLSQLGHTRDAANELQEAVRLAPRDAEFRFKLALALNELGESARVIAELEEAVKLDPRHARAGYNLGLALNAAGNPLGAIRVLIAAELAAPRDPQIPFARATIHAQIGEIDQARSAASRALELNPQFVQAAQLLGQLPSR